MKDFELSDEKAKEIGEYLKNRREELGISTNLVEMKTGINKADISRIENGKKKKINPIYLNEIAKVLKLDPILLFKEVGFLDKTKSEDSNMSFEVTYEMMSIPVFGSVSAGVGYVIDEEPIDYIAIPEMKGDIVGIKVKGDSMEPTIFDGDIVVIKREVEVNVGDIGVFLLDREFGDGVVKRLAKKNGVLVLESDNPYYKPIEIDREKVIASGKVIRIIKGSTNKQKDQFAELFNHLDADKQQQLLNFAEFLKGQGIKE